jgi:hypothetical protein
VPRISAEAFADEVRRSYRRRAEIGPDAHDRELAAELGITVEQFRDPDFMREWEEEGRREHEEWQERRRAEQAQTFHWRAGVKYNGLGERID